MTLRSFLPVLVAASLASASLAAAERHNVVFIICDDLRYDTLGVTGHPYSQTPHIDRIAKEGALFRQAHVAAPLCSPSRASYMTGTYPQVHGIVGNSSDDQGKLATWSIAAQKAGYATAMMGKWHMGNASTPRPGFDRWFVMPGQGKYLDPTFNDDGEERKLKGFNADVLAEQSAVFIRAQATAKKPFFLSIGHKSVHAPITWPKRYDQLYAEHANDELRQTEVKQVRCLKAVDDAVGKLFEVLTETGQLDRTLIIFASDSGFNWGEKHPRPGDDKRGPYDHMTRIPLLMRLPSLIKAGTVIDRLVSTVDVAPTVYDLIGTSDAMTPAMVGRSLRPLLAGETPADWRQDVLIEYSWDAQFPHIINWQSVRSERWSFARYHGNGPDLLFDLAADPKQTMSVLDQQPQVAAELNARLDALLTAATAHRGNQAPTVRLAKPDPTIAVPPGRPFTFDVQVADADGQVARVEYLVDGVVVGQSFKGARSITWSAPAIEGPITVTARATDERGAMTLSKPVVYTVGAQP